MVHRGGGARSHRRQAFIPQHQHRVSLRDGHRGEPPLLGVHLAERYELDGRLGIMGGAVWAEGVGRQRRHAQGCKRAGGRGVFQNMPAHAAIGVAGYHVGGIGPAQLPHRSLLPLAHANAWDTRGRVEHSSRAACMRSNHT